MPERINVEVTTLPNRVDMVMALHLISQKKVVPDINHVRATLSFAVSGAEEMEKIKNVLKTVSCTSIREVD